MKIASVAEVKARLSAYLKATRRGPVVITKNGKAAGVIVSHAEYDRMLYTQGFMESVVRGVADGEAAFMLKKCFYDHGGQHCKSADPVKCAEGD